MKLLPSMVTVVSDGALEKVCPDSSPRIKNANNIKTILPAECLLVNAFVMNTKILITGGTGMVGMRLSKYLTEKGDEVLHLSRNENLAAQYPAYKWDIKNGYIDPRALEVDHIIHLAGAGVADSRWTKKRKEEIYNSRIDSTRLIVNQVKAHKVKLKSFVCASAVGIYGADSGEKLVDEEAAPANDFLAQVVQDWEKEAAQIKGVPVSMVRIGIVLSNEGGALPKMTMPVKFGVGAPLGSGVQYMSWIHVDDLVSMIAYMMSEKLEGAYNAVAPSPVNNKEFTKQIGKVMHRPVWLPNVPGFLLKAALGEMSQVVLGGNRVSSEKIRQQGFVFTYKELRPALENILS